MFLWGKRRGQVMQERAKLRVVQLDFAMISFDDNVRLFGSSWWPLPAFIKITASKRGPSENKRRSRENHSRFTHHIQNRAILITCLPRRANRLGNNHVPNYFPQPTIYSLALIYIA